MAQIPEVITTRAPGPAAAQPATGQDLNAMEETLVREILRDRSEFNGNISFGWPSADTNGHVENIRGSWVTVTLDAAGELGVETTVSHNLNLSVAPTTAPGGVTTYRSNVRWLVMGWRYGDNSGTNAPPPILAGPVIQPPWVVWYPRSVVTADAIDLVFYHDNVTMVINATTPLAVDLFFIPAEN